MSTGSPCPTPSRRRWHRHKSRRRQSSPSSRSPCLDLMLDCSRGCPAPNNYPNNYPPRMLVKNRVRCTGAGNCCGKVGLRTQVLNFGEELQGRAVLFFLRTSAASSWRLGGCRMCATITKETVRQKSGFIACCLFAFAGCPDSRSREGRAQARAIRPCSCNGRFSFFVEMFAVKPSRYYSEIASRFEVVVPLRPSNVGEGSRARVDFPNLSFSTLKGLRQTTTRY
jgi:hypothetical protein